MKKRLEDFYSRASREARLILLDPFRRELRISTHAPLARRDNNRYEEIQSHRISTHAPLARRDRYYS